MGARSHRWCRDLRRGEFAGEQLLNISLSRGTNQIRILASNDIGETEETFTLIYDGEGLLDRRGTLYILAIGVDKYPSSDDVLKDLRFAGADARIFEETVRRRLGPLHDKVISRLLVNDSDHPPTACSH